MLSNDFAVAVVPAAVRDRFRTVIVEDAALGRLRGFVEDSDEHGYAFRTVDAGGRYLLWSNLVTAEMT